MSVPTGEEFHGIFLDGRRAEEHPATVEAGEHDLVLHLHSGSRRVRLADVVIEPPLGRIRRVLHLPDGSRFETDDHEAVRRLEARLGRGRGSRLVHRLEGRWPWVLASLLAFLTVAVLFVRFGLPVASGWAAALTPTPALAAMERQVIRILDQQYLAPTNLPASTRVRLRTVFTEVTATVGGPYAYRLEFRRGRNLGANALALPNGMIVVTDELVRLAGSDRELAGVFAHEAGHVRERHGARSAYQSVGLLVFTSLLTGDITSAGTVAAAIPVLLVQSGYSREMERAADEVAARYLMSRDGTTRPLRVMLERLSREHGDSDGDLLATHPGVEERLRALRTFESPDRR